MCVCAGDKEMKTCVCVCVQGTKGMKTCECVCVRAQGTKE